MDVTQVARPLLERLAETTGEGCQLSVRNGGMAVCVLRIPSPLHPEITLAGSVGTTFPLHAVAVGKVLLAFAPQGEQETYLSRPLSAVTSHTHTDRHQLTVELEEIRQQGVARDQEEYKPGLCAFAVPIFERDNSVRAAIALPFLKASGVPTGIYLNALQATANDISAALGAIPPLQQRKP
jgi:DNA-binding IclR family transcriptional regulator